MIQVVVFQTLQLMTGQSGTKESEGKSFDIQQFLDILHAQFCSKN